MLRDEEIGQHDDADDQAGGRDVFDDDVRAGHARGRKNTGGDTGSRRSTMPSGRRSTRSGASDVTTLKSARNNAVHTKQKYCASNQGKTANVGDGHDNNEKHAGKKVLLKRKSSRNVMSATTTTNTGSDVTADSANVVTYRRTVSEAAATSRQLDVRPKSCSLARRPSSNMRDILNEMKRDEAATAAAATAAAANAADHGAKPQRGDDGSQTTKHTSFGCGSDHVQPPSDVRRSRPLNAWTEESAGQSEVSTRT